MNSSTDTPGWKWIEVSDRNVDRTYEDQMIKWTPDRHVWHVTVQIKYGEPASIESPPAGSFTLHALLYRKQVPWMSYAWAFARLSEAIKAAEV